MAAVVANVEWLIEERIPERVAELSEHMRAGLAALAAAHPSVAGVAGAGLLWAIELVRPDGSGEQFAPDDRHAIPTGSGFSPSFFVASECAKRGVALATAPPNTLRIGPPLATTKEHVDLGLEALSGALAELDRLA